MTPDELRDRIDTIVVVMMENRSFDTVLGHLRHPAYGNRTDIDGIDDLANPAFVNPSTHGPRPPFWRPDAPTQTDMPHDKGSVQTQLAGYAMTGFVTAFEELYGIQTATPPVLGALRPADLPTTHALATAYTVCDRWFACLPTSTAPNRLMSMCGYSDLDDTKHLVPDQDTVYEWLTAKRVPWRVYHAGLPFLILMPTVAPQVLTDKFRRLDKLAGDWASEPAADRPQVIFIEPDYQDSPVHETAPCCNHPPLAMAPGEAFLANIYRTLTSVPARWARTLLVVTYDEHGGLWDHVAPPPLAYRNGDVAFASMGVRTPTIVAGPCARRGAVATDASGAKPLLDNTSILQLLAERFGDAAASYSPAVLARRQQGVASLSAILDPAGANTAIAPLGAAAGVASAAPAVPPSAKHDAFVFAIRRMLATDRDAMVAKFPSLAGYA
jgi:phospholipase C